MRFLLIIGLLSLPLLARDPLAQRIGHTDAAKARPGTDVHNGAGTVYIQTLLDRDAITNLNFMHHGPLMPKSSIGQHYHNNSEEMFLILDADCQFTIDGHTSVLPGPVGVPCQLRHAHAVYNPTNRPADWVNFNVRAVDSLRAPSSNWSSVFLADPSAVFNLGDDRVGAPLENKPVFLNTQRLTRELMRPFPNMNGGKGTVLYRRALSPSAFYSNWAFVDHLIVPPGASVGRHVHKGVEEVYFVMSGEGVARVDEETAPIRKGDAVPIRVKDVHSFENTGSADLEFLIYGVALDKGKLDIADVN